jgi:hypothetical protein
MKMAAICCSETPVLTRTTRRRHVLEDSIINCYRRKNTKSFGYTAITNRLRSYFKFFAGTILCLLRTEEGHTRVCDLVAKISALRGL